LLVRDHNREQRLYHAVFPHRRTSMAEELAHWIAGSGQGPTDGPRRPHRRWRHRRQRSRAAADGTCRTGVSLPLCSGVELHERRQGRTRSGRPGDCEGRSDSAGLTGPWPSRLSRRPGSSSGDQGGVGDADARGVLDRPYHGLPDEVVMLNSSGPSARGGGSVRRGRPRPAMMRTARLREPSTSEAVAREGIDAAFLRSGLGRSWRRET
jgi:hypothetical protein